MAEEPMIEDLLQKIENTLVEFKQDASSSAGIAKDCVAFSNSAGGHILIGIDPKTGDVVGVEDVQTVADACAQAIYERTQPKLRPTIGAHTHDHADLVVIEVPYFTGAEPVKYGNKDKWTVYERVAGISVPVADKERLAQILRERRGNAGFDQLAVSGGTLEDLDLDFAKGEFAKAKKELSESDLQTYGLAVEQNKQLVPTSAGIILFGKHPEQSHPDARFRARRYRGTDQAADVLDQVDLRDVPLVRAVEEITAFIRRNTGESQTLERGASRHRDIPHYDAEIVREVLHNAMAHADFSQSGSHINVSIYSDRLVVDSPGKWMAGMGELQLKAGISKIRNRAIVRIMDELDMIEQKGSIWAKSRKAETERGYPLPEWSDPGPIVRVTIPIHSAAVPAVPVPTGEPSGGERRKAEIEQYLRVNGASSRDEVAKHLGISPRQTRDYLGEMIEEGRVRPTKPPRSPNQRFELTG
jgi:ATP-dependent DNA helicase RecG